MVFISAYNSSALTNDDSPSRRYHPLVTILSVVALMLVENLPYAQSFSIQQQQQLQPQSFLKFKQSRQPDFNESGRRSTASAVVPSSASFLHHESTPSSRRHNHHSNRGKHARFYNDQHHDHQEFLLNHQFNYLNETTLKLLNTPYGSFTKGKHHELYSMVNAWLTLIQQQKGLKKIRVTDNRQLRTDNNVSSDASNSSRKSSQNDNFLQNNVITKRNEIDVIVSSASNMEVLLRRIIEEQDIGNNTSIDISTQLYNLIIQAWCVVATTTAFRLMDFNNHDRVRRDVINADTKKDNTEGEIERLLEIQRQALQRSFDIMRQLQHTFEETQNELIQPNSFTFECIIQANADVSTALSEIDVKSSKLQSHVDILARKTMQKTHYTLLYQEYLYRTNRNKIIRPALRSYAPVIDMYSKTNLTSSDDSTVTASTKNNNTNSYNYRGYKAEQILRLMEVQGHFQPNILCYNLVINAYSRASTPNILRSSRGQKHVKINNSNHMQRKSFYEKRNICDEYQVKGIENAQRIFDELNEKQQQKQEQKEDEVSFEPELLKPDITSYTSLINSWANLNNENGAIKAQYLLFQMEDEFYSQHESSSTSQSDTVIKPPFTLYNTVLKAWCRLNHPDAPKHALTIFQRMRKTYKFQSNQLQQIIRDTNESQSQYKHTIITARPNRATFNTIIHILSKHGSYESLEQAEAILDEMRNYESKGIYEWAPNLFSSNIIIEGYSFMNEGRHRKYKNKNNPALKAYNILYKMLVTQKKQERKIKGDKNNNGYIVSPDTFSFNRVIYTLSKSRSRQSALLIEELLFLMDKEYDDKGNLKMRSDVYSYSSAISAWAKSFEPDAGTRAEALLARMEKRYANGETMLKPNVGTFNTLHNKDNFRMEYPHNILHLNNHLVTFNSVIDCHAKSGQGRAGARKAEKVLKRMEEMYNAGDVSVKPNVNTYNGVLSAWANSNAKPAYFKSLAVLQKMWKLYEDGNEAVKPDAHAYNTVISAVSRSHIEDKAQKALRLLRQMDLLYRSGEEQNRDVRPNEITYTSVLNSCAYSIVEDEKVRQKALDTAIFTLEELMDSPYGRPNHVTYGMFLACCANLIPSDDELRRITVIEPVFLQCCKDGQVNELVLNQLRLAAPDDLYGKLLGKVVKSKNGKVSIEDLPQEWRCKVRDEKWKDRRRRTINRRNNHNRFRKKRNEKL